MTTDIAAMLDAHGRDRTGLLDMLWEVQRRTGYIPVEAAATIADRLGISVEDVLETATFYHFFHTAPAGRHRIYLSNTVIAKMHGYDEVYAALEREAGVRFGEPASAEFGLFETACIGLSDQEPAMLIDGVVFTDLTPESVGEIVAGLRGGSTPEELANPRGLARDHRAYVEALSGSAVHTTGPVFFRGETDHERLLARCRAQSSDEVIATITASGLRGRGGAGFPTGTKWQTCRAAPGATKYIICNADEGEPGTFKDRALLTHEPDTVFAGMAIAAHAVGAAGADSAAVPVQGIVYLRAEYAYLVAYLEGRLAALRERGVLGHGSGGFDIRIQLGAGAYICGDESALIESCEGKRGTPRLKPPFPVQRGYLGMPTVVNNVETFAAAAHIMDHGADWFAAVGAPGSTGTRLLSVSGDCAAPGIYEVEWGTTLRAVLDMIGAHDARAVQISGPSGEMLSVAADADRALGYDDLSCNGSFMVFNGDRDLLDVVGDFMQFFVDESCGICVPCRAGNVLLRQKVALVADGQATSSDLDEMVAWGGVVAHTSRCGLGATSPNPILTTLTKFPEIYPVRPRATVADLLPSFDPEAELTDHGAAVAQLAPQESV
ncbi:MULTISPECIES: NAD(P)H-dependent oxidoreductase subunit E [Mycobacteriaceae]|uniref:NAD(P)H-dependent oxidoreductase subunit E n=1 Tax=Mycolicibacterium parafortuitum TaxID=39692 RepID=A0ACC6ME03_MYCPF|nr:MULTISPECIES: NAD(P)H-dependent oxidoreductase subunit E [Mycobacteriaceae]MDZ5085102.1 NAD(P)H-dependent oxidoreductase subunit E [Mycolicibacterium parafortuitum]GFM20940.1 NAD-reducing hydrogenase diaphorase moiety large subunit [Mycobacterium sp. PO1]GFM22096.1 NAD-reducing hydrogenase diaphorase moiety large subunit [Mycobacterium sp. PO2]